VHRTRPSPDNRHDLPPVFSGFVEADNVGCAVVYEEMSIRGEVSKLHAGCGKAETNPRANPDPVGAAAPFI